ncbi:hypothetical protein WN944_027757 [Citrus x changshan-huyou]|uniref:Uncharacterized protein n=1 Tax=Citrus x changshan-huyou TaxID=2935761 RepID=A0AAP0LLG6_9ROSI
MAHAQPQAGSLGLTVKDNHEFKQKEPFDNFKIYLIKAAFCVLGKRFSALLNGDGSQPHRILSSEHLALFFNGVKESRAP